MFYYRKNVLKAHLVKCRGMKKPKQQTELSQQSISSISGKRQDKQQNALAVKTGRSLDLISKPSNSSPPKESIP
jgi:hypothetical protein